MDENQLRHIFFPYTDDRTREVTENGHRFVYYTTAETAFRIIKNKEIWMRNTSTMNDYLEVEHGFGCLNAAYKSDSGVNFRETFDSIFPGLTEEVVAKFNSWLPGIRRDTYISCVSEHLEEEDQNGRLSMWRAYGGNAGVAVVINPAAMFMQNDAVNVFASPVAYWTQAQVEIELQRIARRIREYADDVGALDRSVAANVLFNMFRFAVLCTKHPGFSEEREWRVIASPLMHPSPLLTQTVEIIRGTPQTVQKFGFINHPDAGITGLELPEILNRVIIGPCEFPDVIRKALHQLLLEGAIPEPERLLYTSDIPLRQPT